MKTKNLLIKEVRTAVFDLEIEESNRKKRAIEFIGNFALQRDLVNTDNNVIQLNKQYLALREAAIEEHKNLFDFNKKIDGVISWMKEQVQC